MPQVPPQKEYQYVNSLWCAYMVSVVAAWNAELVTYPLDLTKTRLQIQGELAKKGDGKAPHRGMIRTAVGIATEEGVLKLWQGLSAIFLRHLFYSGTRMLAYRWIKEDLFGATDKSVHFPVWKSAICGISAGVIGQYIASPADLLKVHLQMEGKRKLMGEPPRVTGIVDAFNKTYKVGGIKGLWKGSVPNIYRAALVNLGDLSTYDVAKRFILMNTSLEDNIITHSLASFAAGFVAAGLATPADVIKTRVMNQPTDDKGKGLMYKGPMDCLRQTVTAEGPMALYKGFMPHWIRLAPWALVFWLSYERILTTIGADQF